MKYRLRYATLLVSLLGVTLSASARDAVLPAGTLLQCTLNEPNFSSATVAVGDPVLCHLRDIVEFGQQAFPRGSYLVGHLESAKDPGHLVGKGYLKLVFDRIGLPTGDLPLDAKVIATSGYRVDREGKIDGKGHAKRDAVEWTLPPLWPWKVIMLPARGPRPKLKGESKLTLRLMDDVDIPQVPQTYGPGWHSFGQPQNESFGSQPTNGQSQRALRQVSSAAEQTSLAAPRAVNATFTSRDVANPTPSIAEVPHMPVFILNTGTLLAVSVYGYQDHLITYTLASGGEGVISSDEVDWNTTIRFNAQRGVRVTLRAQR